MTCNELRGRGQTLEPGDRVIVSRPRTAHQRTYAGKAGVFQEYSHPNRFAILMMDDRTLGGRRDGLVYVETDCLTKEAPGEP